MGQVTQEILQGEHKEKQFDIDSESRLVYCLNSQLFHPAESPFCGMKVPYKSFTETPRPRPPCPLCGNAVANPPLSPPPPPKAASKPQLLGLTPGSGDTRRQARRHSAQPELTLRF